MTRPALRTSTPDDGGQVMLLSLGYAVLALLLITVVVSATSVHLERKRLLATADLAALAAADAVDLEWLYTQGPQPQESLARLTAESVQAAVEDHLLSSPETARFTDLTVVEATTTDGRTARVTLRSVARVPLMSWVLTPWSDGVVLEVTAQARAG